MHEASYGGIGIEQRESHGKERFVNWCNSGGRDKRKETERQSPQGNK